MKFMNLLAGAALAALLTACGGGGGSVASTPTPTPAPTPTPTPAPPPTNTTLTNLQYDQTFAADTAGMNASWDTSTGKAISNNAQTASLSITYDAANNAYTVSTGSYTQTFLPADVVAQDDYDTIYKKDSAYLTLISRGYDTGIETQYVASGLLQRNSLNGSTQDTELTSFTFGLVTSAAATPRSGSAAYATQVFGASSYPGEEPAVFQGAGQLDIDFAQGIFSGQTYLTETGLVTGDGIVGGGIELTTVGALSSTDAGLSGTAIFQGRHGAVAAPLSGSLYGPSGQELGASFSGDGSNGLSVTGAIVGQLDGALSPANLSLLDMSYDQFFWTRFGANLAGNITWHSSDSFTFGAPISDQSGGEFTAADKIDGRGNFTTWQKTLPNSYYGTQDVTLEFYEPGPTNAELKLTYSSFGHWAGTVPAGGGGTSYNEKWFAYGFESPNYALSARTGTASYEGVAYGTGFDGVTRYDVSGTANLDIDFSSDSFTGSLDLSGRDYASSAQIDFGNQTFFGSLDLRLSALSGQFDNAGLPGGAIDARFYGYAGQEIAGTFEFVVPAGSPGANTYIGGAFAAVGK